MKDKFVITENVRRTVAALGPFLEALERRQPPATDRGLVLLEGRTGTGKTKAGEWLATQHPTVAFLRTFKKWTAAWMLRDIAAAVKLAPRATVEGNIRDLKEELERRPRLLILDEGDRIIRREEMLETLRDLYDITRTPMVLVSEGGGLGMLERKNPRTWRRVGQVVNYQPLGAADVQILWEELAEVTAPLSPRQAEEVLRLSGGGSFGEVMVNLEDLERKLKANPGKTLTDKMLHTALQARTGGKAA